MVTLVTGASGFLGSRVVEQLRQAGHRVVTTDLEGDVDIVGDLSESAFTSTLPSVDEVVHCAAVQYVTPSLPFLRRKNWFTRNNVTATRNLIARYDGDVSYFLLVGTSMMYKQDRRERYGIDSPMQGEGVYSVSKLQAYEAVIDMQNPTGIMIPTIIGGPGREGLFRGFVETMTNWGLAVRPGSGRHLTQMVHVEDAASLIVIMTRAHAEGRYNAGAPNPMSIGQWISTIANELELGSVRILPIWYAIVAAGAWATRYRFIAREQALMLGQQHVLDTSESIALGWKPLYSNERIVRDTARYIASSAGFQHDGA